MAHLQRAKHMPQQILAKGFPRGCLDKIPDEHQILIRVTNDLAWRTEPRRQAVSEVLVEWQESYRIGKRGSLRLRQNVTVIQAAGVREQIGQCDWLRERRRDPFWPQV